jgi:hypothetical protein
MVVGAGHPNYAGTVNRRIAVQVNNRSETLWQGGTTAKRTGCVAQSGTAPA